MSLFWQYPVITEKTFALQNGNTPGVIALPWATMIDKKMNIGSILKIVEGKIDKGTAYNITCCQHIYFRRLIPLLKQIGIDVLYTPHKIINEDMIDGVIIKPCPLFAVNIEDDTKNTCFKNVDFITRRRKYLYSFQGAYQSMYMSNIRQELFKLEHGSGMMGLKVKPEDVYIKNIGEWHFNQTVYSTKQNENGELDESEIHEENTRAYNNLLLQSTFSLCPSGSGPNSIRFWEALAVGSIPVLLSDKLDLPKHPSWAKAIIRFPEGQIRYLDAHLRNISALEIQERRKLCIEIYSYFRNDFANSKYDDEFHKTRTSGTRVVHYCSGSYANGDFGGDARYDHHLKRVVHDRRHFKWPEQRNLLVRYLEHLTNVGKEVTVITDNHMACDIPNKFQVLIVNHGCARKTALQNPNWDARWREICVEGQDKMLQLRDPNTTEFLSVSQEVRDDFISIYGEKYSKFKNRVINNSSDFDEKKVKVYNTCTTKREQLKILGDFGFSIGDINKLKRSGLAKDHVFNQLNDGQRPNQDIFLSHDMFLNLSSGGSNSALDAAICGMVVISCPVGIFAYEVPEECFVKIDIDKAYDEEYLKEKFSIAWSNKEMLSNNIKRWYQSCCTFEHWKNKLLRILP